MPIPLASASNDAEVPGDQATPLIHPSSSGDRLMQSELQSPRVAQGVDHSQRGEGPEFVAQAPAEVQRRIEELLACQKKELLQLLEIILDGTQCSTCSKADETGGTVHCITCSKEDSLKSAKFTNYDIDEPEDRASQSDSGAISLDNLEDRSRNSDNDVISSNSLEAYKAKSAQWVSDDTGDNDQTRATVSSRGRRQDTKFDLSDAMLVLKAEEQRNLAKARLEALADEAPEMSRVRMRANAIVASLWFESAAFVAIVLSSAVLGVQVEYSSSRLRGEMPIIFKISEIAFSIVFAAELALRIVAGGIHFFSHRQKNMGWNYFDTVCVSSSIVSILIDIADPDGSSTMVSSLSRIGRMVRVVRVLRLVKFIPKLKAIVTTFWSTLSAMLWVLILMLMVMFLFSVIMTQAATAYLLDAHPDDLVSDGLSEHFGSLVNSIYTLFQVVTNGLNWKAPAEAIGAVHVVYRWAFLAYISVILFAFMNVITGFICEHSIATVQRDRELVVDAQLRNKEYWQESFKKLFGAFDIDGSGELTVDEFEEHMEDSQVCAYFEGLDLDLDKAWDIFRLLDDDESGTVSMNEFVEGCLKLRGHARSMDLAILGYDFQKVSTKLGEFMAHVEAELHAVKRLTRRHMGEAGADDDDDDANRLFSGAASIVARRSIITGRGVM